MRRIQLPLSTLEKVSISLPFHEDFFLQNPSLSLEVGCGNGLFIIQNALAFKNKTFIGCEIKKERYLKTAKQILKHELSNAFVAHLSGEEILQSLPNESLESFYMNFPDPWPKKRHHKRRFFYPQETLTLIIQKLKKEGRIYFASDHKEYFSFVLQERLKPSCLLETPLKDGYTHSLEGYFSTLYEEKWKIEKRELYYTYFIKKSLS
jgi:tRNA (guanine-N7-)-methyltransferase